MLSGLKYMFSFCFLVISLFLISFYLNQQGDNSTVTRSHSSRSKITEQSITSLGDNKTIIISAYYDSRGTNSVRVLAIVHQSVEELYCWFHCAQKDHIPVIATIDLHEDRFGFPYGTADLLCTEPPHCDYVYVSIHWSRAINVILIPKFEVRNHPPETLSANFTICISTLFGDYKNVLQLIQSFEMYKLLGANRVTIYKNRCHRSVDNVLQYYIKEGFLEVIDWPIDRYLRTSDKWHYSLDPNSQVGYYGQTATLNDCLYRNMYRSKFVLLNDIDEVILPVKHQDWMSLMSSLQKQYPYTSVFRAEPHVFPTQVNGSYSNMWSHIPGVNIFIHTYREPLDPNVFKNWKMIVDPRMIFQTSIHSALKVDGESTDLPTDTAITFHCRKTRRSNLSMKSLIEDNTIWRYNVSLVEKVEQVLQNIQFDSQTIL